MDSDKQGNVLFSEEVYLQTTSLSIRLSLILGILLIIGAWLVAFSFDNIFLTLLFWFLGGALVIFSIYLNRNKKKKFLFVEDEYGSFAAKVYSERFRIEVDPLKKLVFYRLRSEPWQEDQDFGPRRYAVFYDQSENPIFAIADGGDAFSDYFHDRAFEHVDDRGFLQGAKVFIGSVLEIYNLCNVTE